MLAPVNARTLADLDNGNAGLIIDAAIRAATFDLDDRGNQDHKAREVQIKLVMELADNGQVVTSVECSTKIPPRRANSTFTRMHIQDKGPTLLFQTLDARDPDQRTIDEIDRRTEE